MILGISLDIDELDEGLAIIKSYSSIEHIQIHYDANTKLQDYEWFVKIVKKIYPYISFSIHAYNEINFAEENVEVLSAWKDVAKRTINEVTKIDGEFVNFHFGMFCDGINARERNRDNVIAEFVKLQKYAHSCNVEIHIENIYSTPSGSDYQFLGDRLADFDALYCQNLNIPICYDFGHGNISGLTNDFLRIYISRIKSMHIHDNNGILDLHDPIGQGTIEWENIFSLLKKESYNGYFILEHYAKQYDLSLKYLESQGII